MGQFIRCQRQRVGKFAALGLAFVLLPLAAGVAMLVVLPPGMFAWAGAVFCILLSFFFAYPTLRMFHWIETDGRIVRGKRFWTRRTIERDTDDLEEFRAGLGQFAEKGRDPALGAIKAYNYQFLFRDRTFMFLSCFDMTNTDAFVEALVHEPATGARFPVQLAGARLGGYVNHADAELGRSYAYYAPGHLSLTVYIYTRGDEPVPDGTEAQRVVEEFEEVNKVVAEVRGSAESEAKCDIATVTLGEFDGSPRVLRSTFAFDVEGEEVESRVYITGWRGRFLKLRCTMPAAYRNCWGPGLSRIEEAVGRMMTAT